MLACLGPEGRMAIVLDTGAVSRGSGSQGINRERDIRQALVTKDLIEAVFLLPENLFYNTSAPGIVMLLSRGKRHPGEILLVNGSTLFVKGRPKNALTDEHITLAAALFHEWRADEGLSAVVTTEQVAGNDFNLSPSRYVAGAAAEDGLSLEEAVAHLKQAEAERVVADTALWSVLEELGIQ